MMRRVEEDDLELIDFKKEDDYLIDFPFRDSLEDLRLSVTFDNVNECDRVKLFGGANSQEVERDDCDQTESVEPKRPSFLRKSLAWDSAFFTSAGVLNHEELFMINKGFKKAESNHRSPGHRKDVRPRRVTDRGHTSFNDSGFRLETLKGDLLGDVKPNIHNKLNKRSKLAIESVGPTFGQANPPCSKKPIICSQNKVKPARAPKSPSLNPQGPKGMAKTSITAPQIVLEKASTWEKISTRQTNKTSLEGSANAKMENKTRKAGSAPISTVSKRSRWSDLSGLPKSSFNSPTIDKDPKVHRSYGFSSSASSLKHSRKSIRRKTDVGNTKMTISTSSVPFSCSSSTSPGSSIDGWIPESLSVTSRNPGSSLRLNAGYREIEERKVTSEYADRFSDGQKRKIKSSGLRMPSPKIGFFDEVQPPSKFYHSADTGNRLKFGKTLSSVSSSELKHEKENVCSFEEEVNGLSRYFEVIDLGVGSESGSIKQTGRPVYEHITTAPCSRTPLAEKTLGKQ